MSVLYLFVYASYEGRLQRDFARTPVFVTEENRASEAVARWHWRTDVLGEDYVDVLTTVVLKPDAPPPPGVAAWPAPGAVYASPALLNHKGGADFFTRYGKLAGTISVAQLSEPGERIAYVGAAAFDVGEDRSNLIEGYGGGAEVEPGVGVLGSAGRQQSPNSFYFGLALFGVAPALLMTVVVSRMGAERRDRDLAILSALGVPGRRRSWLLLREVTPAAVIGASLAAVICLLATTGTWPLPGAHYWVVGSDLRTVVPLLPVAVLLAVAVVSGIVMFTHRSSTKWLSGTRPAPAARPISWLSVLVLVVVLVLTNYFYGYFYVRSSPQYATLVGVAGAALVVMLVGPAASFLLTFFARSLRRVAYVGSRPAVLITARELEAMSAPVVRATASLAAVIVLAVQIQVWMSVASWSYRDAQQFAYANQGRSLSINLVDSDAQTISAIAKALPKQTVPILLSKDSMGEEAADDLDQGVAWAPCTVLHQAIQSCPKTPTKLASLHGPLTGLLELWLGPEGTVVASPTLDSSQKPELTVAERNVTAQELLVLSTTGTALPRDSIARQVNQLIQPPVSISTPMEEWLVGGATEQDQGRWFGYGGALAIATMFLISGFALTFELIRLGRKLAPLRVIITTRKTYAALAAGLIGLPTTLITAFAVVVSVALVLAPTAPGRSGTMPTTTIIVIALMGVVLAATLTLTATRMMTRAANQWVPTTDP